MKYNAQNIIGEIVAEDYRTAHVFKSHNIDFCCNGNRTVADAIVNQEIDLQALLDDLDRVQSKDVDNNIDFKTWPADLLIDYIIKVHHRYVNEKIPVILQFLHKVKRVHGKNHPELYEVNELFHNSSTDLLSHMHKEENILFPYARELSTNKKNCTPPFGTVKNPIQIMMHEHENEGERFRKIRHLTSDYSPPNDACTTYRVAFSMLQEFEEDLHKHIHLENNILFPKILKIEELHLV